MTTNPQNEPSQPPAETTMAHHKAFPSLSSEKDAERQHTTQIIHKFNGESIDKPYGVPSSQRILTPGLLQKHFHSIRRFLEHDLGLSTAEREAVLRLLRLQAYYSNVYPKASQVAEQPGCSKRTFWRAIDKLKRQGLVAVINRFVIREEAQISNLYVLRKLMLAIIRYLHEHSVKFHQAWLQPFLSMPGAHFWRAIKKWPWALNPGAT